MRTYTELSSIPTLEERFAYLSLVGEVGNQTFGYDRYVNQRFYHSREWRNARNYVILRDLGDLGMEEFPFRGQPQVHHMNPLTMQDFEEATDNLLDPEYLIAASHITHNAIHYGDSSLLPKSLVERRPGDTLLW